VAAAGAASASVTIVDNDLPTVTLNTDDLEILESGSSSARLVVSRSGDISRDLAVNYLVTGTATSGRDYDPLPGTMSIPAGAGSEPLRVAGARVGAGRSAGLEAG